MASVGSDKEKVKGAENPSDTGRTDDTGARGATGFGDGDAGAPKSRLGRVWYEEKNREIVVYYLIAVCFLELVVGAIAFFYGVIHAAPLEPGGPKMARFPWVGWLVAAVLSPVGLLLLLHLSGQFFSRALNAGERVEGGVGGEDVLPPRLQRFYAIARHAPTIVILLGLVALGCTVLFVDSAMEMVMAVGAALRPYILWIIGGVVFFLLAGYLGRLWFISRHNRMEREYAYRMKVLETTGIVLMDRKTLPLRYENGQLRLLASNEGGELKALPETPTAPADGAGEPPAADAGTGTGSSSAVKGGPASTGEEVEDATIISEAPKDGASGEGR